MLQTHDIQDRKKLLKSWLALDAKLKKGEYSQVCELFQDWSQGTFRNNMSSLRGNRSYSHISNEQLELLIECARIVVSSRKPSKAKVRLNELKAQYAQ